MANKKIEYVLSLNTENFKANVEKASKKFKEGFEGTAKKSVKGLGDAVKNTGKQVSDGLGKAGTEGGKKLKASVKSASDSMKKDVESSSKQAFSAFTKNAEEAGGRVKVSLGSKGKEGLQDFNKAVSDSGKKVRTTFDSSKQGVDKFGRATEQAGNKAKEGFNKGKKSADDFNKKMKEGNGVASGLGSGFKKLGGILAGVFAVSKIKDFFVEAVKNSAELKAVEAQFTQVFGDSSKGVQQSLDKMGKEMGILPGRLKPGMSAMTSMFKGLGISTAESTDLASTSMRLSADAAAFYDKSLEDTQAALQSFIVGNTEAGRSIGIYGGETQIANFASKELGLEWKNLDEAGKQVTRLKFAESMQKMAKATGQAARESDGLENQMGNLKMAWKEFTAQIGEPILAKVVIPAISAIVKGLSGFGEGLKNIGNNPAMQKFMEVVKETGSVMMGDFKSACDTLSTSFTDMETALEPIMNVLGSVIEAVGTGLSGAIEFLAPYVAMIIEHFKNLAPKFEEVGTKIGPLITNIMAVAKVIFEWLEPAFKVFLDISGAVSTFLMEKLGVGIEFVSGLFEALGLLLSGDTSGAFELLGETVSNFATGTLQAFGNLFKNLLKAVGIDVDAIKLSFGTKVESMKKSVTTKFTSIKTGISTIVTNMKDAVIKKVTGFVTDFKAKFEGVSLWSIGSNIISGLLRGLTSAWTAVSTWVTEKAGWIGRMFAKKNEIASPSRLFKRIGGFIDEGLVLGLKSGERDIDRTITGIAQKIPSAFSSIQTDFSANIGAVNNSSNRSIQRSTVQPIIQVIMEGDIGAVVNKVSTKLATNTGLLIGGRV